MEKNLPWFWRLWIDKKEAERKNICQRPREKKINIKVTLVRPSNQSSKAKCQKVADLLRKNTFWCTQTVKKSGYNKIWNSYHKEFVFNSHLT